MISQSSSSLKKQKISDGSGIPHSIESGTIEYLWVTLILGLVFLLCCVPMTFAYHNTFRKAAVDDLNQMMSTTMENVQYVAEMREAERLAEQKRLQDSIARADNMRGGTGFL